MPLISLRFPPPPGRAGRDEGPAPEAADEPREAVSPIRRGSTRPLGRAHGPTWCWTWQREMSPWDVRPNTGGTSRRDGKRPRRPARTAAPERRCLNAKPGIFPAPGAAQLLPGGAQPRMGLPAPSRRWRVRWPPHARGLTQRGGHDRTGRIPPPVPLPRRARCTRGRRCTGRPLGRARSRARSCRP